MKFNVFAKPNVLAITVATMAAMSAGAADAALIQRVYHQNAANHCQGALPAFAGTLRARPLGVGNEGNAPAFLTCSFETSGQFAPINRLSVFFANNNDAGSIAINCTGVFGVQRATPVYLAKSVNVTAGATGNLVWTDADNGGEALPGPGNISCAMAPGAVMLDIFNYFDVEIGS